MAINAKTWGSLAAAILMGGIAAKVGHDMLSRKPEPKVVVQNVTRVVVAAQDLAPGVQLKAADLSVTQVTSAAAQPGTFDAPDRLANRVTTVAVHKGQPIYENMLSPAGSAPGLGAIVPDGFRAVTMEINEFSGVAGLIVPGCHVDVVTTIQGEGGTVARTIVRDVAVLAVGRKYAEPPAAVVDPKDPRTAILRRDEPADAPLARSVTLLLKPKQAEIIDLASHTGNPRLVLRGSRESQHGDGESGGDGVTVAELRGGQKSGEESWVSTLTRMLQPIAAAATQPAPAQRPVQAQTVMLSTTRPAKEYREVTVIRRTAEQSVRFEVPAKKPTDDRKPVLVNTDASEALPVPVEPGDGQPAQPTNDE